MASIRFRKLRLEGFGRYAQPVEVCFHDGINVYIAPNEGGKSTLVAGIEAVLFGLERSKGPKDFRIERFESWYPHDRFAGEVELDQDGKGWLLKRTFPKNKIEPLVQNDRGEWQRLGEYTHNPRARKPTPVVDVVMRKLLGGITSRQVFENTFCLPQLLPDGSSLSREIQALLSGGDTCDEAIKKIVEQAKQVTRYTGDRGLTPRNGHNAGKLEEAKSKVECRQKLLCESEGLARNLHQKQQERERLQKRQGELTEEMKKLESKIDTSKQWLEYYRDYKDILSKQNEISSILKKARQVQQNIQQAQEEMKKYPSWCQRSSDPQQSVRDAENSAHELLRNWQRLQEHRSKLREIDKQIDEKYRLFEDASEEDKRLLERYETEKMQRETNLQQERGNLEQLQQKRERYELARRQYEEEFGSLAQIPEDAIRRKIELMDKPAPQPLPPNIKPAVAMGIVGLVLLVITTWAGWVGLGVLLAILASGIALLVYRTETQRAQRSYESALAEYERELEQINEQLGAFAEEKGVALGTLLEKVRQRDNMQKQLEEMENALPPEHSVKEAEERVRHCEEEIKQFKTRMGPYERAFGDNLPQDYKEYRGLVDERKRLEQSLAEDAQFFDVSWQEIPNQPCRQWRAPFEIFAEEMNLPPEDAPLAQLVQRLSELTKEFWEQMEERAERYAESRQRIAEQEAQLKGILHDKTVEQLEKEKQHLDNQAASILSDWRSLVDEHPYLPPEPAHEETEGDKVAELKEKLQQEIEELEQKRSEHSKVQQQMNEVAREIGQLEGRGIANIAKLQEEIEELEREQKRLAFEADSLTEAYRVLQEAKEEFHRTHRQQIAQLITEYFTRFAPATAKRRVELDEQFALQVYEGEKEVDLLQLSRGALDQLYLAARFAIADFLNDRVKIPFIFDDSFVHCDAERRENIRQVIEQAAQDRQIIILSHDEAFKSWGAEIQVIPVHS